MDTNHLYTDSKVEVEVEVEVGAALGAPPRTVNWMRMRLHTWAGCLLSSAFATSCHPPHTGTVFAPTHPVRCRKTRDVLPT